MSDPIGRMAAREIEERYHEYPKAARAMLAALRIHKAWSDSEKAGPDYGGQSRGTHPDGELIWRAWWNNQLDLCDRANTATDSAIAAAEAAGIKSEE